MAGLVSDGYGRRTTDAAHTLRRSLGPHPMSASTADRPTRESLSSSTCIQLRRWTGSIFDWNFVEDGRRGHGANQRIADRQRCRGVPARRSARSRFLPPTGGTLLVMSYIENGEMETALDEYADETGRV